MPHTSKTKASASPMSREQTIQKVADIIQEGFPFGSEKEPPRCDAEFIAKEICEALGL
jgi:hypothetical protein